MGVRATHGFHRRRRRRHRRRLPRASLGGEPGEVAGDSPPAIARVVDVHDPRALDDGDPRVRAVVVHDVKRVRFARIVVHDARVDVPPRAPFRQLADAQPTPEPPVRFSLGRGKRARLGADAGRRARDAPAISGAAAPDPTAPTAPTASSALRRHPRASRSTPTELGFFTLNSQQVWAHRVQHF